MAQTRYQRYTIDFFRSRTSGTDMPDFLPDDINQQLAIANELVKDCLEPLDKRLNEESISQKEAAAQVRHASQEKGIFYT